MNCCEWGECDGEATTTVDYPAVVPGTAGRDRCWDCGVRTMAVCGFCAEVARAEVADRYPAATRCDAHAHEREQAHQAAIALGRRGGLAGRVRGSEEMAKQEILKKQSRDGREIVVTIQTGPLGTPDLYVAIAGKTLGPGVVGPPPKPIDGVAHVIACSGKLVGLTATEAEMLGRAIEQARAEDPESKRQALRSERAMLHARIRGELDEVEAARERAFERDMEQIPSYDNPKVDAAYKALADFDLAHPEIKAELEREAKDSAERNAWM